MADTNLVVLVGRLTREAETKFTSGGMAICSFSLAVNQRVKKGDGWADEASFFDCNVFGKTAENVGKYLVKGKQVAIDGRIKQDRWEKDGQTRSRVVINADNVQLLGGGQDQPRRETAGNDSAPSDSAPPDFPDDMPPF